MINLLNLQTMERESGYYWVRDGISWYVAKWYTSYKSWSICGNEEDFNDSEFEEIDERKIVRP